MKITTTTIKKMAFEQLPLSVSVVHTKAAYEKRIAKALAAAQQKGLTHLLIYADKEHFANLHYFTGFDPRFEEALLIVSFDYKPLLLVGHEGALFASIIPIDVEVMVHESMSLLGQNRHHLSQQILNQAYEKVKINTSSCVGLIGWKYFTTVEAAQPQYMFETPHYLVESLHAKVGKEQVINACELLMGAKNGLRARLDIDEMAVLELSATKTSRSVYNFFLHLEEGMSEMEASLLLGIDGNPVIAHPVVDFTAEAVLMGLSSPTEAPLKRGSVYNVGFGYRSSLVARTGIYVTNRQEFDEYYPFSWEKAYVPYYKIIANWYNLVRIGTTGQHVVRELKKRVPEFEKLGIGLNPGHLIHNDEWVNSLFVEDEAIELQSGMALQSDIIANPVGHPGLHIEDGLILADKQTQQQFAQAYPEAYQRIQRRQKMMKEVLHFDIGEELMPLSDMQGLYFPFGSDVTTIMAVAKE